MAIHGVMRPGFTGEAIRQAIEAEVKREKAAAKTKAAR